MKDDFYEKMDPEKVRDPKTKEHKLYRLGKSMNLMNE